jgi:hypothetical protein
MADNREFFENPRERSLPNESIDLESIITNSDVLEHVLSQLDAQYIDENVRETIKTRINEKLEENDAKFRGKIKTLIEVAGTGTVI